MSTMMLGPVVGMVMVAGWGGLMLWAAVLAFRGKKFWGSWLMLVGASLQLLGGVFYVLAMMFMFQNLGSGSASGPASMGMVVMVGTGLLIPLGLLLNLAGLLGVCSRVGNLEKRAAALELLKRQLPVRIQG
jgi:hypothetical protein